MNEWIDRRPKIVGRGKEWMPAEFVRLKAAVDAGHGLALLQAVSLALQHGIPAGHEWIGTRFSRAVLEYSLAWRIPANGGDPVPVRSLDEALGLPKRPVFSENRPDSGGRTIGWEAYRRIARRRYKGEKVKAASESVGRELGISGGVAERAFYQCRRAVYVSLGVPIPTRHGRKIKAD